MKINQEIDEKFGGYLSHLQSINKSDETVKQSQNALKKFVESGCKNTFDFVKWYRLNYPKIKEDTIQLYRQNIDRCLKWQNNNSTNINNNMDMSDINNNMDINNNIKSMDNKRSKKSITFSVDTGLQEKFIKLANMIQKTQTELLTVYMQNFVSQNESRLKEFERLQNEVIIK